MLADSGDYPKIQGNASDRMDNFKWPYVLIIFWKFLNLF